MRFSGDGRVWNCRNSLHFVDMGRQNVDNGSNCGGCFMSEEQIQKYLERLETRGRELVGNWGKAQEVLQAAGICDANGKLTELYK